MIQILITGGTFDKSYNHISGDLFFDKTHVPEMLKRSKCRLNIEVKTLMMIDSLEMTEKNILDAKKIYGMVTNIDENFGKLINKLDELNLRENTIVVFMTDNGPQQPRYVSNLKGLKSQV